MNTVANMTDVEVNTLVNIAGTVFDRHVKLSPNDRAQIKEMKNSGRSVHSIAKEFGVADGTINYWLKNEVERKVANKLRNINYPQPTRENQYAVKKERIAYKRALLEVKEKNS